MIPGGNMDGRKKLAIALSLVALLVVLAGTAYVFPYRFPPRLLSRAADSFLAQTARGTV